METKDNAIIQEMRAIDFQLMNINNQINKLRFYQFKKKAELELKRDKLEVRIQKLKAKLKSK
jgi:hypothetical protein